MEKQTHNKRESETKVGKPYGFVGLDDQVRIIWNKYYFWTKQDHFLRKELYLLAEIAMYFSSSNFSCTRVVKSIYWYLLLLKGTNVEKVFANKNKVV